MPEEATLTVESSTSLQNKHNHMHVVSLQNRATTVWRCDILWLFSCALCSKFSSISMSSLSTSSAGCPLLSFSRTLWAAFFLPLPTSQRGLSGRKKKATKRTMAGMAARPSMNLQASAKEHILCPHTLCTCSMTNSRVVAEVEHTNTVQNFIYNKQLGCIRQFFIISLCVSSNRYGVAEWAGHRVCFREHMVKRDQC